MCKKLYFLKNSMTLSCTAMFYTTYSRQVFAQSHKKFEVGFENRRTKHAKVSPSVLLNTIKQSCSTENLHFIVLNNYSHDLPCFKEYLMQEHFIVRYYIQRRKSSIEYQLQIEGVSFQCSLLMTLRVQKFTFINSHESGEANIIFTTLKNNIIYNNNILKNQLMYFYILATLILFYILFGTFHF